MPKLKVPEVVRGRLSRPRDFSTFLDAFVDEVFEKAFEKDWTWGQFALHAGVCPSTINRLGRRITESPALLTIWKISKAVDMELKLVQVITKRRKAIS
jgi:hypothetical protein